MSIVPIVTVPPSWHLDRERSATMMQADQGVAHFGTAPTTDVIEAYYPVEIGTGLVVSRYTSTALPEGREAAIAAAIDGFEHAPTIGELTDKTGVRKVADRSLQLTMGWREAASSMRYMYRMVVAADATSVVAVIGQCLERDDASVVHVSQCRQALLTLDTGIAVVDRVGIALPGMAAERAIPEGNVKKLGGPTTLSDGAKFNFPPMAVPPSEATTDRRPYYIGLGVAVMAIALWWSRRSREKFGSDDGPKDDDADDLRAAASGQSKKDDEG